MGTYEYILKKYNLHPRREFYIEIPNMGRGDLAKLFAELKFTKGAEIGVEKGIYSEVLLKANPNLQLFSIDPWSPNAYEPDIRRSIAYGKAHAERCFSVAKKRLSQYKTCIIIRKTSMSALKNFEDNSLDFVYIDGNHDFVNVTNDIHEWAKKVRTGGIVSGHDYAYFPSGRYNHVKHVLLAYTRAYGIKPVFIVGAFAYDKGMIRDKFRSWFWVKR